jgi:hypothetical protein
VDPLRGGAERVQRIRLRDAGPRDERVPDHLDPTAAGAELCLGRIGQTIGRDLEFESGNAVAGRREEPARRDDAGQGRVA